MARGAGPAAGAPPLQAAPRAVAMCAGPRQPRRTSHLSSGPLRLPALAPPRQERSSAGGPSSAWMLGWSGPRPRRAPAASARPARGRAAPRRTAAFSRRFAPSPPRRSGPPAAARASPVRQASLRTGRKTPKGAALTVAPCCAAQHSGVEPPRVGRLTSAPCWSSARVTSTSPPRPAE